MTRGLVCENLSVRTGGRTILDAVDLAVGAGEYLALLGPSGCGKTTLLRALAGLVPCASGRIERDGETLLDVAGGVDLPPEERGVGMVFQHQALWPHLDARATVRFALRHGAGLRGSALNARADALLAEVHLADRARALPGVLSGGERQRLSIARALAREPRLLLLDEPLGPLDAHLRREIFELLRELHRARGLITLHVTHDRDEAFAAGGRAAILRAGKVLQTGTREELRGQPVEPFVAAFLDSRPMPIRIALAVLLLASFVAAVLLLGQGSQGPPGDVIASSGDATLDARRARLAVDATTCAECHPEIYAQWEGSQHAKGFLNPDVRELSGNHSNENCIPCHAPRPIYEIGLDAMPRSRLVHREQGVSCQSCHLIPASTNSDGIPRLAGTRNLPEGTCGLEVVATPTLATYRSCETCHNQHETTNQWKETPYGSDPRSCLDCHMEHREFVVAKGMPARLAYDHAMPGSHDPAVIASAIDVRAEFRGDEQDLLVAVTNARAGHHFPTEERSRAVDVYVQFLSTGGEALGEARHLYRFRDPYRGEQGIERTLLPHGQTWSAALARDSWPEGARSARVWIDYKRRPYEPVPESHLYRIFEKVVELP